MSQTIQDNNQSWPSRPEEFPELMTESELIKFLRISEVTSSKDHHNVIENLKRMHDLPRVHICGKPLFPKEAIMNWVKSKTTSGK